MPRSSNPAQHSSFSNYLTESQIYLEDGGPMKREMEKSFITLYMEISKWETFEVWHYISQGPQ